MRGTALPETAIVLTAMLAMIYGILQLGILGCLQVMCDGAAFVAAHEYSLGVNTATTQYTSLAQRPFPLIGTPISIATNSPDVASPQVPVTYPVNSGGQSGGASLLLPNHTQATVTIASSSVLGGWIAALSNLSILGSAIEPSYMVVNDAYNIQQLTPLAGTAAVAAGVPLLTSTEYQLPDYYISAHRFYVCNAPATPQWTTCPSPSANLVLDSLGTAEFLDTDNWARVGGTNGPYTSNGVGQGTAYPFAEMFCHANVFAKAATTFVYAATTADLPTASAMYYNVLKPIRLWDYFFTPNYNFPYTTPGNYSFLALNPDAGC